MSLLSMHYIGGVVFGRRIALKNVSLTSHLLTCMLHGSIAVALLFIHRSLFWNIDILFDSPLTIAFVECFFTSLVCGFFLIFSKFSLIDCIRNGFMKSMYNHSLSITLPFLFALMIGFNNLCIYYMDIPMYFICRSFTIPFNMILAYTNQAFLMRWKFFVAPVLIIIGYIITIVEQYNGNLLISEGIVFGFFSALFVSLFLYEMKHLENTSTETRLKQVYLNNVISCGLLFVAILFTEVSEIRYFPVAFSIEAIRFGVLMLFACIFSVLIGQWKLHVITSCPTHVRELFSLCRSLLQTLVTILFFHIHTTFFWWFGFCLVATGSAIYWLTYYTPPGATQTANEKEDGIPLSTTQ